ncbi:O-antigen ligase family protein [Neomesorhizobium albiziae]|uniref:O-antigen ligase family protein n=1 Tax=Neomesorhizobium albiziae TaxID=335020 RepID=UPI00122D38F2|nr:O-antigen ligase domain-containing protein [Mesorhizobium albiziae]
MALQIPWIFSIGDLRLTPYRLVLLILLPTCLLRWMSGKVGKVRLTDVALFLFCGWCAVAMVAIHGLSDAIEPAGILFLETMGGFLVARCYIRDEASFRMMAKVLFLISVILLPFALHEALTGGKVLLNTFRLIMPTYIDVGMPERWGLDRAQGNYIHPIHFGVNIGSTLTLTFLVLGYGKSPYVRMFKSSLVFLTSFLSLSSGPLTSMVGQIALLSWDRMSRGFPMKWSVLAIGGLAVFIMIEMFANRSLAVILIGYFAFDEYSAYIRTLTWQYGTQSIMNHPLWGVGFGPWDKPEWLTSSIDMHWIIDAVRHGIPAGFLVFLAFFSALLAVGRAPISDEKLSTYRTAYMITMVGFFMTGWAVYFWESSYILFTFLLGSGFWLIEADAAPSSISQIRRSGAATKNLRQRNSRENG